MSDQNDIPEVVEPKKEEFQPKTPYPNLKNLSRIDTAILAIKKLHPEATAYEVGKSLKENGILKNRMSVYTRLKANDYLKTEFDALESYHRQQLIREDYPLARKGLRKFLKNKDKTIPAAVQMQAIKLTYDKVHADRQDKVPEHPVNIENIERLQILVQGVVKDGKDTDDASA